MTYRKVALALEALEQAKTLLTDNYDLPTSQWIKIHLARLLTKDAIALLSRAIEELNSLQELSGTTNPPG